MTCTKFWVCTQTSSRWIILSRHQARWRSFDNVICGSNSGHLRIRHVFYSMYLAIQVIAYLHTKNKWNDNMNHVFEYNRICCQCTCCALTFLLIFVLTALVRHTPISSICASIQHCLIFDTLQWSWMYVFESRTRSWCDLSNLKFAHSFYAWIASLTQLLKTSTMRFCCWMLRIRAATHCMHWVTAAIASSTISIILVPFKNEATNESSETDSPDNPTRKSLESYSNWQQSPKLSSSCCNWLPMVIERHDILVHEANSRLMMSCNAVEGAVHQGLCEGADL